MIGASLRSFLSALLGSSYYKPLYYLFYSFLFAHTDESVIYPGNLLAFDGDGFVVAIGSCDTFAFTGVGFVLLVDSVLPLSTIFGSVVGLLAMDTRFMAGGD